MLRVVCFLAVLAGLLAPVAAGALILQVDQLAKIEGVKVVVANEVTDGCLPLPNVLQVEAELIMRRSGIKVLERDGSPVLAIFAIGQGLPTSPNVCIASLAVLMWRPRLQMDGTAEIVLAASFNSVHYGPKDRFQQQLREHVNQTVTNLANEILKSRQQ